MAVRTENLLANKISDNKSTRWRIVILISTLIKIDHISCVLTYIYDTNLSLCVAVRTVLKWALAVLVNASHKRNIPPWTAGWVNNAPRKERVSGFEHARSILCIYEKLLSERGFCPHSHPEREYLEQSLAKISVASVGKDNHYISVIYLFRKF